MRGLLCELNNSCYSLPQDEDVPFLNQSRRDSFADLIKLATELFQLVNHPEVISSGTTLANFFKDFSILRNQATLKSQNISLSQYLYMSLNEFNTKLFFITNNSILVDNLMQSNPNYNYLYSSFSKNITEKNMLESFLINRLDNPQQIIDLLYGSGLDVRKKNKQKLQYSLLICFFLRKYQLEEMKIKSKMQHGSVLKYHAILKKITKCYFSKEKMKNSLEKIYVF